jgi:polysaccharide biosynthesis transport protein
MRAGFAQQGAEWFDPQIEKIRADVSKAQKKLAQFQTQTNIVSSQGGGADSENEQLVAITAELSKAKAELIALESQLAGSPSVMAQSNEAQSVDLTLLTSLRSNLSTTNSEIARLQKEVGAGNPKLAERLHTQKSLEDQINSLISDGTRKLKKRIEERKGKIATLEAAREAQLRSMISVQSKRDELTSLIRDVEFRQSELERAQKSASQARLQSQLSFTNIAVLDRATPPLAPAFPKPIIVGLGSPLIGLAFGMITALLVEALDRRIRCAADLEFICDAPVLGTLRSSQPPGARTAWATLASWTASYRDAVSGRKG